MLVLDSPIAIIYKGHFDASDRKVLHTSLLSSSDCILLVLLTFLRSSPVYIESTVFSARNYAIRSHTFTPGHDSQHYHLPAFEP